MANDGFFTFLTRNGALGDDLMDLQQRSDIADLGGRLDDAHARALADAGDFLRLRDELAAMKIAFGVLSKVLVASGAVDATVLDAELSAALTRAKGPQGGPVVCANCAMTYPKAQTEVTAAGVLCKRCRSLG